MRLLPFISVLLLFSFANGGRLYKTTITGTITEKVTGTALQGVQVTEKGTRNAVVTKADGSFSIDIKGESGVLVISYIGYETQEIKVNDDGKTLAIKLEKTTAQLDEVVVIGYARSYRKMLSGNVSTVKAEDVERQPYYRGDGEGYESLKENVFLRAADNPLSTFSIDVDAASYSNIRRMLTDGDWPPEGAVRVEEMINYFRYDYAQPTGNDPFALHTELAACPWNNRHRLLMVGMQAKTVPVDQLPPSNLVFLIDVSGSMNEVNKLPLVKKSLKLLTDQLRPQDKVSLVVYAGSAGVVLPATEGNKKTTIKTAIDQLEAGGGTAGGAGIQLAYQTARNAFVQEGNNRVILCTDGDFNVGQSSDQQLEQLIEKERKSGIFLSVLGFGTGNYQDAKMQKLADKGNGNHAYIDNFNEARKVLVSEFGGTLFTIAKDVKLQVEFNPALVQGYRLIGYENRMLAKEDFNDDQKDAGELGSGHTVTALYEIIPVGVKSAFLKSVDKLKYQQSADSKSSFSNELATIKGRYKEPDGKVSKLVVHPVGNTTVTLDHTSDNFRFAAAVTELGMLLRHSPYAQRAAFEQAEELASGALGADAEGYRHEFVQLVRNAQALAMEQAATDESLSKK